MGEARTAAFAAHAAAREADEGSARPQAARATGHAAATAHVPTHAPHAADYAIKAIVHASTDAAAEEERDWQHRRLPEHLWPVVLSSQKN